MSDVLKLLELEEEWDRKPANPVLSDKNIKDFAALIDTLRTQNNANGTLGVSTVWSVNSDGKCIHIPVDVNDAGITYPSSIINADSGIFLIAFKPLQNSKVGPYLLDSDDTRHAFYWLNSSTFQIHIDGRYRDFTTSLTNGEFTTFTIRWDKTTDLLELYKNGVAVSGGANAGTWGATALGANVYIGRRYSYTDPAQALGAEVSLFATFPSAYSLSTATIKSYGENPWQLFEPKQNYFYKNEATKRKILAVEEEWDSKPSELVELKQEIDAELVTVFNGEYLDHAGNYKKVSESGVTYNVDGVSFEGLAGNQIKLDKPLNFPNECTIIVAISKNTTSLNSALLSDMYVSNWNTNGISANVRSGGGLSFIVGSKSATRDSSLINDGNPHTIIYRYKSGEPLEIHLDGAEITYDTQQTALDYVISSGGDARIGTYYDESAGTVFKGTINNIVVLKEKIPLTEAYALAADLLKVFQPKQNYLFKSKLKPKKVLIDEEEWESKLQVNEQVNPNISLQFCYLFNDRDGTQVRDSANKNHGTVIGSNYIWHPDGWEQTSSSATLNSYIDTGYIVEAAGTVIMDITVHELYNWLHLFSMHEYYDGDYKSWIYSTGQLAMRVASGDTNCTSSTGLISVGGRYRLAMSWTDNGTAKLYCNGVLVGTQSCGSGTKHELGINAKANTLTGAKVTHHSVAVFNKQLPDEIVKNITKSEANLVNFFFQPKQNYLYQQDEILKKLLSYEQEQDSKPIGDSQLSTLGRRFSHFYAMLDSSTNIKDLISGIDLDYTGQVLPTVDGLSAVNNGTYTAYTGTSLLKYTTEWTFVFVGRISGSGTYSLMSSDTSNYPCIQVGISTGEISVYYPGSYRARTASNVFSLNELLSIVITYDSVNYHRLWVNGKEISFSASNQATTYSTTSLNTRFFSRTSTSERLVGHCALTSFGKLVSASVAESISKNPYQLFEPKTLYNYFETDYTAIAPIIQLIASAILSGTAIATISESDVVAGGKTLIITLTNDTWDATLGENNSITTDLINGIDSAQSEPTGWDAVVKANMNFNDVTRTSDTVCTITLGPEATYDITAQETITVTIPASALVTSTSPIVCTPVFTISAEFASVYKSLLLLLGVG